LVPIGPRPYEAIARLSPVVKLTNSITQPSMSPRVTERFVPPLVPSEVNACGGTSHAAEVNPLVMSQYCDCVPSGLPSLAEID